MLRTTVYLDDQIAVALRHLAETQKRSQAEIIRDALSGYIGQFQSRHNRGLTGVGQYRSGRSDVSENAEKLLRDAAHKRR